MPSKIKVLFLFALIVSARAQVAPAVSDPAFPKDSVGSLEFDTTRGKSRIGSGCIIRTTDNEKCYIITARHLLGPNVDFPTAVAPQDLASVVRGIHFYSLAGTDHYYSVTGLAIKTQGSVADPLSDLAVFQVNDSPKDVLILAVHSPMEGDLLWIVGKVRGGVPEGELAHPAKAVKSTTTWANAQYANDNIDSYGASGAPVLNSTGDVVGVNCGHLNTTVHKTAYFIPESLIAEAITREATSTP